MVMYHLRIFAVTSGHARLTIDPRIVQLHVTDVTKSMEQLQEAVQFQLRDFIPAGQVIALGFAESGGHTEPIRLLRNQVDLTEYLGSLQNHPERVITVLDIPTPEDRRKCLRERYLAIFRRSIDECEVNVHEMNGILVHNFEKLLLGEESNREAGGQDLPQPPAGGAGGMLDHELSQLFICG